MLRRTLCGCARKRGGPPSLARTSSEHSRRDEECTSYRHNESGCQKHRPASYQRLDRRGCAVCFRSSCTVFQQTPVLRGRRIFGVTSCSFSECFFGGLSRRPAQPGDQLFCFLFDLCIEILARNFQKDLLDLYACFLVLRLETVVLRFQLRILNRKLGTEFFSFYK